jgi:hypothetical protein
MKYFLSLLIIICFIACTSKLNLQKRKYNTGYYISFNHKHNQKREQLTSTLKVMHVKTKIEDFNQATHNINAAFSPIDSQIKILRIQNFNKVVSKKSLISVVNFNFQPNTFEKFGKKQAFTNDPKSSLFDTILYVALSVLTGSFFIFGLWSLLMYILTTGSFYLLISIISFLLAGVLYFLVKRKAE